MSLDQSSPIFAAIDDYCPLSGPVFIDLGSIHLLQVLFRSWSCFCHAVSTQQSTIELFSDRRYDWVNTDYKNLNFLRLLGHLVDPQLINA
jgi:hypothetical protein